VATFGGENAESYYDEGVTALMKGDAATAASHFEKAIGFDRSFFAAYHQLGRCYLRMGQGARGLKLLRDLAQNRPGQAGVLIDLGFALIQEGQSHEARRIFEDLLLLEPENVRAHEGMARASYGEGDWNRAAAESQAAAMTGGKNFGLMLVGGRAARRAGDDVLANNLLEEAAALLEQSADLKPEHPESHYLRGEVELALGRTAHALTHFEQAEAQAVAGRFYSAFNENFTLADIVARVVHCHQALGNQADTRASRDRLRALAPDHPLLKDQPRAKDQPRG